MNTVEENARVCNCPPHLKESVLSFGKQNLVILRSRLTVQDGGGVRTLSSLLILKQLLVFIRDEELERDKQEGLISENVEGLPLACHYFSFMFGSGFGG